MNLDEILKANLADEAFRKAFAEEKLIHCVGKRVLRHRLELNMSQADLARLIGSKQPRVARIESGENISLRALAKLALALGCEPRDLISEWGAEIEARVPPPESGWTVTFATELTSAAASASCLEEPELRAA